MSEEIAPPAGAQQQSAPIPPAQTAPVVPPATPTTPPPAAARVEEDAIEETVDPRVRKANEEAKRYRLQLRETEGQLKALTERLEALEKASTEAQQRAETERQARLRIEAASQAGLPAESAKFLTGTTPEEITASAQELAKLMPARQTRIGNSTDTPPQSRAKEIMQRIGGQPQNILDPAFQRSKGGGITGQEE